MASYDHIAEWAVLPGEAEGITQATELPDANTITLYKLSMNLTALDGFDAWFRAVQRELSAHGLERLIDITINRPHQTDASAKNWLRLSKMIRGWLATSIADTLLQRIESQGTRVLLADEFMEQAQNVLRGKGFSAVNTAWNRLLTINRANFSTASQYIQELQQRYTETQRLNLTVSPRMLLAILCNSLKEEIQPHVASVFYGIMDTTADDLTAQQFYNYCATLQNLLPQENDLAIAQAAPRAKKPFIRNHLRRKAPPQGVSPEKNAKNHRENPQQRDANGNCSYCGLRGHDARDCYYLDHTRRSPTWKGLPDLWAYYYPRRQKAKRLTSSPTPPAAAAPASTGFDLHYAGMAISIPSAPPSSRKKWLADTGSSQHICADTSYLISYRPYDRTQRAYEYETSNGQRGRAIGQGTAKISFLLDDGHLNDLIFDCEVDPSGPYNLFSTGLALRMMDIGYNDINLSLQNLHTKTIIGHAYRENDVPFLRLAPPTIQMAAISPMIAHQRLAHAGLPKQQANQSALGDEIKGPEFHCAACKQAKSKRIISRQPQVRATNALDFMHADLQPVTPTGLGGYNYDLVLTDDATRCRFVFHLKEKGQASDELIKWCQGMFNITGRHTKEWRIDGGREFFRFTDWATGKGIHIQPSAPYAHEQNGLSESTGNYLIQTARAMIIDAKAPKNLWPEATSTACYIINRMNSPGQKAPVQAWRESIGHRLADIQHDLSFLRVWYSRAYVNIPPEKRKKSDKMAPRAWIGHLVGYEGDNGHLYRIYNPRKKTISIHRDVVFFEGEISHDSGDDDHDQGGVATQNHLQRIPPYIQGHSQPQPQLDSHLRYQQQQRDHENSPPLPHTPSSQGNQLTARMENIRLQPSPTAFLTPPQHHHIQSLPQPIIAPEPSETLTESSPDPHAFPSPTQQPPQQETPRRSTRSTRGQRQSTRYDQQHFPKQRRTAMLAIAAQEDEEDDEITVSSWLPPRHNLSKHTRSPSH